MDMQTGVDFEKFRESWLSSVREGQPSTLELGRRFAVKLVTQWIDASEQGSDLVLCDGTGDGGIDIALLDTGTDASNEDLEESGHIWYLVQSKYGSAFAGVGTLLAEGQKIIDTLDGKRAKLSSLAEGVLERLRNFRNGAGSSDRIVVVFATDKPLNEAEHLDQSSSWEGYHVFPCRGRNKSGTRRGCTTTLARRRRANLQFQRFITV